MENIRIFEANADAVFDAGFYPIPVRQKEKGAANKNWNQYVPQLPPQSVIENFKHTFGNGNIGIATGTHLNTGKIFAAVDVDTPGFVPFVKAILRNPISGKIGSKGATFFCQSEPNLKSVKLKTKDKKNFDRWEGASLLEVEHDALPIMDAATYSIIKKVITNPNAWDIIEGGSEIQGHEPMLSLTSCGIASLTENLEWLADCLNTLLHPEYSGNTRAETLNMLVTAKEKGLGKVTHNAATYEAGNIGPIPLGYLDDGRYVFLDQRRSILLSESSNRLTAVATLIGMAPHSFWQMQYPRFGDGGKIIGVDAHKAADCMMEACRKLGGFDTSRVRGRGVYLSGNEIVVNWDGSSKNDGKHIYLCHLPLTAKSEAEASVRPQEVLELFNLFKWEQPSEPYLLLGWTSLAVICGVLDWRPHIFLSGRKKFWEINTDSLPDLSS